MARKRYINAMKKLYNIEDEKSARTFKMNVRLRNISARDSFARNVPSENVYLLQKRMI